MTISKQTSSYLSFVGARSPFIYVAVPKAACSTLKNLLYTLEKVDIPCRTLGLPDVHFRHASGIASLESFKGSSIADLLADESRTRFTVVRNPYARLASAWANKIYQQAPAYRLLQQQLSGLYQLELNTPPGFSDFVDWVITQNPHQCDLHWRPMHLILQHEHIHYHFIGRTESLAASLTPAFDRMGVTENVGTLLANHTVNESLPIQWQHCYTQSIASKVQRFYARDFEMYGYSPESWQIGPTELKDEESISALKAKLESYAQVALQIVRNKNRQLFVLKKQIAALGKLNDK